LDAFEVPTQQFSDVVDLVIGDAGEDAAEVILGS
jgi:hypothetical protein